MLYGIRASLRHAQLLTAFMVVVVVHWGEHFAQMGQIWAGIPRREALGLLGLVWPSLVRSEVLHFGFAVAMLLGLIVLRRGFYYGPARNLWTLALAIQVWHFAEHGLLIGQAMTGQYLFGATAPMSVLQQFFPRAELHCVYTALVTVPALLAIYLYRQRTKQRENWWREAQRRISAELELGLIP